MKRPISTLVPNLLVWGSFIVILILSITGCSAKGSGSGGLSGDDYNLAGRDLDSEYDSRFGSGTIPTAEGEGIFRDVMFAFDSSALDDVARQDIDYNAEILKANPDVKVVLEGHCDERGTSEYNMALGARRSQSVLEALVVSGIARGRMESVSYGSEVPLVQGHDEASWAKNRRVHFSPFREVPR